MHSRAWSGRNRSTLPAILVLEPKQQMRPTALVPPGSTMPRGNIVNDVPRLAVGRRPNPDHRLVTRQKCRPHAELTI